MRLIYLSLPKHQFSLIFLPIVTITIYRDTYSSIKTSIEIAPNKNDFSINTIPITYRDLGAN